MSIVLEEVIEEVTEDNDDNVCHITVEGDKYALCFASGEDSMVYLPNFYRDAIHPICLCGRKRCKKCIAILNAMVEPRHRG
jgi:hypothetical protein